MAVGVGLLTAFGEILEKSKAAKHEWCPDLKLSFVLAGCDARMPAKGSGELTLVGDTAFVRYLYQREFGIREQFLGVFDPLLQDILMGGHSYRLLEHGNKVVRAKQRDLREIIERQWLV
jgi:hypothetical protein